VIQILENGIFIGNKCMYQRRAWCASCWWQKRSVIWNTELSLCLMQMNGEKMIMSL